MTTHSQNEKRIFYAASEVSDPAERTSLLDRLCEGDANLRARVDALLLADESRMLDRSAPDDDLRESGLSSDNVSTVIGRYKLLQKIGEGGFGVVYMGEQQEPVIRRVALKIIKPGMDTKQIIARFEAERQALAMMEHPNIARVFDAGQTDKGRPYFVMELVRGVSIVDYCDQQKLTNQRRLQLFRDVCGAIQHAHQKGIIHRDLKPSNILVTLHDGEPVPKVIDFGIAKATQQRLTDKTVFTRFEQFIGTPVYMSPEQAEMSGLDVDTRSDIYSLGVLLYELLTGQTPFDRKELAEVGFDEMRRRICDVDPPTPSTRVIRMEREAMTKLATNHQCDPAKMAYLLQGDLDWIVMKAMEKDRSRRYETANAFSEDVSRYLRQEPVLAAPPSRIYRFRKFAKRNLTLMSVVGLVAAILIAAASISTWQALRANRLAQMNAASEQDALEHLYVAEMSIAQNAVESGNIDRANQILTRYIPKPGETDLRNFEWRYLWRQSHRELFSIPTDDALFDVDIARSGNIFATAARGGRIRVWSMSTKTEIASFQLEEVAVEHPLRYVFVAISPDERVVAGCSSGTRAVVLWNLERKSEIKRFEAGGRVGLREVGFTPDGRYVFTGEGDSNDRISPLKDSPDGKLWIWDVESGKRRSFQQHQDSIWSADVSLDGQYIATASIDGAVKILDRSTEKSKLLLPPSQKGMQRAKFSDDGRLVAAVPRLWGSATVWNTESGEQVKHMVFEEETINAEFSPDGSIMAVSELRGAIHLIDASTWKTITSYYHDGYQQNMTAISPRGDVILSVGSNGKIKGWGLEPENDARPLEFDWDSSCLKFSADGAILAIGLIDGSIHVYDAATLEPQLILPAEIDPSAGSWERFFLEFFSISPNGKHIARYVQDDPTIVEVWDLENERVDFTLEHDRIVTTVTYSADGNTIVTGTSADGRSNSWIRSWDAKTGQQIGLPIPQQAPIGRLALSPDSKFVAISLSEKSASTSVPSNTFGKAVVFVYDRDKGKEEARLQGHVSEVGEIQSLEFSHDGRLLATAGYDWRVILWETQTWQQTALPLGHTGALTDLCFSPDDSRLASSGADGWVRLWDLKTHSEVTRFRGRHVEFSRDGVTVAIGSSGGAKLHTDHILGPDGSLAGFKEGSDFLTVRILRAPYLDGRPKD